MDLFTLNHFRTVPPRGSHSTRISFKGLFGGSHHRDVALLLEVLECRGQGHPRLFHSTLRFFLIHPRQIPSSARAPGPNRAWVGSQVPWPHNNPSKSCYPSPRTDRRVLMTSDTYQCLSILVTYRFLRLFVCPRHVSGALGR